MLALLGQAAPAPAPAAAPEAACGAGSGGRRGRRRPVAVVSAAAARGLPPDVPQVYLPARRTKYQALGDLENRLGVKLNVSGASLRYDAQVCRGWAQSTSWTIKRSVRQQQDITMLVAAPSGAGLVRWGRGQPTRSPS